MSALIELRGVTKTYGGFVALDDVTLSLSDERPSMTAIAGESGSGKSTLANLVLGFVNPSEGDVLYQGTDVAKMNAAQKMDFRREVQAVFQDPYAVYNPFYRVKHIFDMSISNFRLAKNRQQANDLIEESLNVVGMRGEELLHKYPHQLSGGQRQRMMVARAYMLKPKLIVADEPVSMVDASLRAMILDIMLRLRNDHGISFLYITHDLSTAYQIGDHIYMLYQGAVAEKGKATDVIEAPKHPYVQLLIESIPVPDPTIKWAGDTSSIDDEQMRTSTKSGCRFYSRCPHHMDVCLTAQPSMIPVGENGHEAACYLYK